MKIAYIIYNERPMSGLLRSQVLPILKEMKHKQKNLDIVLIAFWQPLLMFKYISELIQMKKELSYSNIQLINLPLAIPSRHFFFNHYLFKIVETWGYLIFRLTIDNTYDVIHCRSYFASYIASKLSGIYRFKLIFDLRSIFPLENIRVDNLQPETKMYHKWLEIEKRTINKSSFSVAVTQPMVKYINNITTMNKGVLIPISVDINKFIYCKKKRNLLRQKYNLVDKYVIVFQGSLGLDYSWNNITNYAKYFKAISSYYNDAFFLILTENVNIGIEKVLADFNIPKTQYLIHTPKNRHLPDWLSAADAGINVMSKGPDSSTRLGVKVVEYLSCSLPIIVNKYVGAAAEIANKYDTGVVIDVENKIILEKKMNYLRRNKRVLGSNCRTVAENYFSVGSISNKYIDIYNKSFYEL